MLLSGDEFCNTQYGNNNAYCQDNKISWLDWNRKEQFQDVFEHFRKMIHFRKEHHVVKGHGKPSFCGLPSISFHGVCPWEPDQSWESRVLGILFAGRNQKDTEDEIVYIGMNMHWESHHVELPLMPEGYHWEIAVNTAWNQNVCVYDNNHIWMEERSVVILEAKKDDQRPCA